MKEEEQKKCLKSGLDKMKEMRLIRSLKNKYLGLPLQVKASLWFMMCSLVTKSISVVSTVIVTRLMTTEQYGLTTLYYSWFEIVSVVATLNLSVGVFNVGMTKFENDRARWISTLCFLSMGTTIIFSICFLIVYRYVYDFIQLPFSIIVFMLISIFPSTVYSIWLAGQRYILNYKRMVGVTLASSILILVVGTVAVYLSPHKGEAKIISNGIVTIVFGVILLWSIFKETKEKFLGEYALFAFKYNIQMFPAFIAAFLLNQMDRIMIENMCGRSQQGIYSFAYNAAIMISIVGTSLSAVFNPWLMQRIKERRFTNIAYVSSITAVLFFLAIVGFIMIAPEVVLVLGTRAYYEAVYIVPAVAGSTFFSLIYTFYSPILQYNLKASTLSVITAMAGVINFFLNYFCIQKWGYIAAGYTTFACYFLYGWGTAYFAVKVAKDKGYENSIFNHKFLMLISIILLVLAASVNVLYTNIVIRVIVLLLIALICFIYRKKLLHILDEMKN